MRRLLIGCILLLLAGYTMISCGKNNLSGNLSLLQHKWNVVSISGEVYYYKGTPQDYYDFRPDKILYAYRGGLYDTSAYTLTGGGNILLFYHIANGIQSQTGYSLTISALSSSKLILQGRAGPPSYVLDSLSR